MIQLKPREYFVICRQISDPLDTDTYYVRATIRNARTDELLETVDLEDQGDQRFRGDYQVPAYPSAEGLYISITTQVYTDSGYTSESSNYARVENEYLIQERYNPILAGGAGINYKKVREIIKDELKGTEKKVNLKPLISALSALEKAVRSEIRGIYIPKQKDVDLLPVLKAIKDIYIPEPEKPEKLDLSSVLSAIRGIPIPKQEKINLEPVLGALKEVKEGLGRENKELGELLDKIEKTFIEKIKEVEENIVNVKKNIKSAPIVTLLTKEKKLKKVKKRKFIL